MDVSRFWHTGRVIQSHQSVLRIGIRNDVDQVPRLEPVQHSEEDPLNGSDNTQYRPIEQPKIQQPNTDVSYCAAADLRTYLAIRSKRDLSSACRIRSYTRSVLSAIAAQEYMSLSLS